MRLIEAERLRDRLLAIQENGGAEFVVVRAGEHPARKDRVVWDATIDQVVEALNVFMEARGWST